MSTAIIDVFETRFFALAVVAVLILASGAGPSQGATRPVVAAVLVASSFDGDLRDLSGSRSTNASSSADAARRPLVRRTSGVSVSMPGPATSFEGLSGNALQPDPTGDVGSSFYIEAVNGANGSNPLVAIFDKVGNQQVSVDLDSVWKGYPGSPRNRADPTVIFDPFSQKWIVADVCYEGEVEYECIAVTKAGFDPVSGGWWLYALKDTDPTEPATAYPFSDYPKMAVWRDSVILATEEIASGGFSGAGIWAFNRQLLENGMSNQPQYFHVPGSDLATNSNVLPASYRGTRPSVGTPEFLVGQSPSPKALNVWHLRVDFATPANSALDSTPTAVSQYPNWAATEYAAEPPVGGKTHRIVTNTGYLMQQAQYRIINGRESLWVTSGKGNGSTAGVLWTQINVTGGTIATTAVQSNLWTNGGDRIDRFMPSLAVDHDGNMAVGYTASSTTLFPSIRWSGRLVSDPLGRLRDESTVYAGGGSDTAEGPIGVRWGDYTSMSVDPSDDCTFWYVNEYFSTSGGTWKTRIATFKFPSCGRPAAVATATAPPLLLNSPFTVSFSRGVRGVRTSDLLVRDPSGAVLGGALSCDDIVNVAVDCATGPVSTLRFSPSAALTAGSSYRMLFNPPSRRPNPSSRRPIPPPPQILDFETGAPVDQTEHDVRAQTVFTYRQYPVSYAWGAVTTADALGGSYVQEQYPQAAASYSFSGSSLALVMWCGPDRGTASVTITTPGQPDITETIDTYAATAGDQTFTTPALTSGTHTVTIRTTSAHNQSSTGSWIGVDAVTVDGVTTDTPNFATTWSEYPGFGYSFSGQQNASVSITFYGTGVIWRALFGPNGGQAQVTVDGVVYSAPDLYSPTSTFKDIPITGITTTPRLHTLQITVLGSKQGSSSDTIISVERLTVV